MSAYPVGATWEAVDKRGCKGRVRLSNILDTGLEVWRWDFVYPDGSTGPFDTDWGVSYRTCRDAVAGKLKPPYRFKRVK